VRYHKSWRFSAPFTDFSATLDSCSGGFTYNRTHKNKSSHYLSLSPSLSPSPCRSQKLQSILSSILKHQNFVRLLLLQLLLFPPTTGSAHAKTSYLQIQKMALSVSATGALLRESFLLKNPQIIRGGAGKSTVLVTIKRPGTRERQRWKIDSALVRTSLQITVNTVYISPDERGYKTNGQLDGPIRSVITLL